MTKIPYLDDAWQPVTGCSPISPGCENCYAATMAQTGRLRNHRWYKGLAKSVQGASGLTVGKWTGEARCNEDCLDRPLRWRKPRVIGVCFQGDLFHGSVPFEYLDKVFAVMALCPQHTFVICTKRAERMRRYLTAPFIHSRVVAEAEQMAGKAATPQLTPWPVPVVHLGVTVESQDQTSRVIDLVATPAAHRWISYEPAIGDLGDSCDIESGSIDAIVIGCESGPNRRPCDLAWVRQVRDDCQAAGVKLYVKQLDIGGKVVKEVERFPDDLQIQELNWRTR